VAARQRRFNKPNLPPVNIAVHHRGRGSAVPGEGYQLTRVAFVIGCSRPPEFGLPDGRVRSRSRTLAHVARGGVIEGVERAGALAEGKHSGISGASFPPGYRGECCLSSFRSRRRASMARPTNTGSDRTASAVSVTRVEPGARMYRSIKNEAT
jgi:hypothetical protein